MNKRRRFIIAGSLVLVCLLATGTVAASLAGFDLSWHVVAGGGGQSTSASYILGGSIGQPAAGVLSSAGYRLGAGFWYGTEGAAAHFFKQYVPVLMKKR